MIHVSDESNVLVVPEVLESGLVMFVDGWDKVEGLMTSTGNNTGTTLFTGTYSYL